MSSLDGFSSLLDSAVMVTAHDYRADSPAVPSLPQLQTKGCWRVARIEESLWIASPTYVLPK